MIDEAVAQGFSINVDGPDLDLAGPQQMPDEMLRKVRQLKPSLIAYLTGGRGSLEGSLPVPDEWLAGVARAADMPPPRDWPADIWTATVSGMEGFLNRWGGMAALLDWSTLECFGVNERAPYGRVGQIGLALSPYIEDLAMVLPDRTVFRRANGSRLSHYRKAGPLKDRVPIWELA